MIILLYIGVSLLITFILNRQGQFKNVSKSKYLTITALGFVLPFVDIVQTWIGFEYEGNLILLLIPGEYMWPIFISSHIALSFLMLYFGKKGMADENVNHRIILTLVTIYFMLLTVMNAVFYPLNLPLSA